MHTAYLNAEHLYFPALCIRCSAPPQATHDVSATRRYDFIFVAAWESLDLPVPVCAPCKRYRRLIGAATFIAVLLFIVAGGFLAFVLLDSEWRVSAAILGSAVVLVAVAWRFRGDEWLEWYTVGMRATLLRGRDNPLRLSFRRHEYSAAWHDVNPRAVASRADLP